MSGYKLELGTEQLKRLAELLMGAAHADGDYDGDEAEAIGDILHELMEGVPVPNAVTAHLARFDVDTLDIPAACALLRSSERPARRAILALISHVLDADGMLTDEESDYIKRIGQAIGAHIDEYRDLTLDLTIMIDAAKM